MKDDVLKVSELVKHTKWSPGSGYEQSNPTLSVFLPTFRRGADGLLKRVIDRILEQTFSDFELILIDDASTDGSADIIAKAMDRDPRVSCLTHPKNIGLPAVSVYESYARSRGEFIIFAFDDYIFEKDAFQNLVTAARAHPHCFVHGYSQAVEPSGKIVILGRGPLDYSQLRFANFIANSSFIIRRSIFEDVGLVDPHIVGARLNDWDLLRRIERKYRFVGVDKLIGCEWGGFRNDSLGNTYPMFFDVMQEFFGTDRNESLRLPNFPEQDVWAVPDNSSAGLVEFTIVMREYFASKSWAENLETATFSEFQQAVKSRKPIIGIYGSLEASLCLFFDASRKKYESNFQFITTYRGWYLLSMVLHCDCVIISRGLFGSKSIIDLCKLWGIDLYYYIDDNFIVLKDHGYEDYTVESVRKALEPFKGVLVGSHSLGDYFSQHALHKNVLELHLAFDASVFEKYRRVESDNAVAEIYRVGMTGGDFRAPGLINDVLPAIEKSRVADSIELHLPATTAPDLRSSVRIVRQPRSNSYGRFLDIWSVVDLDVLVHPKSDTVNEAFKNENIILTSLYLGAVPVVPDEIAFGGLDESCGVIRVNYDDADGWQKAIERLADRKFRAEMFDRLKAFCADKMSVEHNNKILEGISEKIVPKNLFKRTSQLRLTLQENPSTGMSFFAAEQLQVQLNSRSYKLVRALQASPFVRFAWRLTRAAYRGARRLKLVR